MSTEEQQAEPSPPKKAAVLFTVGKYEVTWKLAKWGLFLFIFLASLIALVVSIIYTEIYIHSFRIRVDCNPDLPLNYEKCLQRGCIWVQRSGENVPPCFFPYGYGYKSVDVRNTSNGYHVKLKREQQKTIFGNEVDSVNLGVTFETSKRLRLKFVDNDRMRYEVPLTVPSPPPEAPEDMEYRVEFQNEPQFGVKVTRVKSGTALFDSNVPGMVFSDQFLQLTTKLASSYIYGLGERLSSEYIISTNWKKISMFARDTPPEENINLYGVHPFYMNLEEDGNAHGVFFLNSNAMEVLLQPYPALTFRTIGGILDFYIFLGPTPEEVVQQYLQVVGLPFLPPYWSLGFHLSRYGYRSTEDVRTVAKRTLEKKIPYDVQHFDIDYMEDFRDFTLDKVHFKDLNSFVVHELQEHGIKTVIILDPGIASNKTLRNTYMPLSKGLERDIFIKLNGTVLEAKVWPGKVYFPDFTNPGVDGYWGTFCSEFRTKVPYDGLWIDMNEPASFVDGSLNGCASNSLNYPPYAAGVLGSKQTNKLYEKTICMDADHYGGKHYDLHSLYGHFQAIVTYKALTVISHGVRPFVLSRSTYSGSGKNTAHWLGDNTSIWPHLRASIPGILSFNIFGIPFVGADICGFFRNTTEELCLRWMQLGAFYPFSRNHNALGTKDQDPGTFSDSFVAAVRESLLTRYKLLPYLYTLFHFAHTKGATVARPLLHEFPKDKTTWTINYQFLWGPALLISPVVTEGAKEVDAYFPEGIWYDFYTGEIAKRGEGTTLNLKDENKINLHVRGGFIIPLQNPQITTAQSRKEPMGLFVAPNESGTAKGFLFWDDGVTQNAPYLFLEISFKQDERKAVLSCAVKSNNYPDASKLKFKFLTICNQKKPPSVIKVNGLKYDSVQYLKDKLVLQVEDMSLPVNEKFTIHIHY